MKQVSGAESVTTILDVPLLESPPIPLKEMSSTTRTLESADVNMAMARKELGQSPLYRDQLVSARSEDNGDTDYLSARCSLR